jgi:hypothetical protein
MCAPITVATAAGAAATQGVLVAKVLALISMGGVAIWNFKCWIRNLGFGRKTA